MLYFQIFLAFFVPGIVGYGGGPATIPLIEHEVVNRFGWISVDRFAEILALGNTLPGPIATKMAGYIGYEVGGIFGAFIALFASVFPSLLAMIILMKLLFKYKDSPKVKRMTNLVRPTIGILLAVMAFGFISRAWVTAGITQTIILVVISVLLLEKWKLNPVYVILGFILYGAFSDLIFKYFHF